MVNGLSGPALIKAGAGVSSVMTASVGGEMDGFIAQARAFILNLTKHSSVDNDMFAEYVERSAAVEAISYDMKATYTSRVEAEDMINVHLFRMGEIVKLLEQDGVQDFLGVNS